MSGTGETIQRTLQDRLGGLSILFSRGVIDGGQLEEGRRVLVDVARREIEKLRALEAEFPACPEGMSWTRPTRTGFTLVDERGRTWAMISRRRRRFRWEVFAPHIPDRGRFEPVEAGISLDLGDAMYEAEGSVMAPLEGGRKAPNPEYDPSRLPTVPIRPSERG